MNEKKKNIHSGVTKTKILVVDDHPVVRDGLAMLIDCQADMVVIARAGTAAQAILGVKKHAIDVAVVDMLLKQTTGAHITRKIKALRPNLVVLIFSMSEEKCHIQEAFDAGAAGYITKDEVSESIIDAIRQVLDGKPYLSCRLSKLFTKPQLDKLLT